MKAGIYQCYDGTLVYVAKDRSIKAFTSLLCCDEWTGEVFKGPENPVLVASFNREQKICFGYNGRDVEATRIDNVPNGCTDPLRVLATVSLGALPVSPKPHYRTRNEGEHLVDYIYDACNRAIDEAVPPQPALAPFTIESELERLFNTNTAPQAPATIHVDAPPTSDKAALKAAVTGELTSSRLFRPKKFKVGFPVELMLSYFGNGDALPLTTEDRRYFFGEKPYTPSHPDETVYDSAAKTLREKTRVRLRELGFRFCHKASAKKHRKRGRYVVYMFGGEFAWRESTQDERAYSRTGGKLSVLMWPVGSGKTGRWPIAELQEVDSVQAAP